MPDKVVVDRKPRLLMFVPLILLSGIMMSGCAVFEEEIDIALSEVPAHVMQAAQDAVEGIVIGSAEIEIEDGMEIYELEGKSGGKEYEIEISKDGKVLEIEPADEQQ